MARGWWTEPESTEIDLSSVWKFNYKTDTVHDITCLDYGATIEVHFLDPNVPNVTHTSSSDHQVLTGLGDIIDWQDASLRQFLRCLEKMGMPEERSIEIGDKALSRCRPTKAIRKIIDIDVYPPPESMSEWAHTVATQL